MISWFLSGMTKVLFGITHEIDLIGRLKSIKHRSFESSDWPQVSDCDIPKRATSPVRQTGKLCIEIHSSVSFLLVTVMIATTCIIGHREYFITQSSHEHFNICRMNE